jgi:nucleoside-diphosphate-sugar epimerase
LKNRGDIVLGTINHNINSIIKIASNCDTDYIIHLAAYGNHYYQKDFKLAVKINILNLYNLLELTKDIGYSLFYNFSTSSVTLENQTYYSITKFCGEQLAAMYDRVVNIRPYSVYGPGEAEHRFIPTVIRHLRSGEFMLLDEFAVHDWIYIDSFIEAFLKVTEHSEIGTGIMTTNLEVVRMLEEISGKKLNYTHAKLRIYDTENWICKNGVKDIGLFNGLKLTYESITRKNL